MKKNKDKVYENERKVDQRSSSEKTKTFGVVKRDESFDDKMSEREYSDESGISVDGELAKTEGK